MTPTTSASPSADRNKILWLSIVQGWAILTVVIGHVSAYTYSGTDNELFPFSHIVQTLIYSFHMPLFMFVSGGLLYFTRIEKNWSAPRLYIDKLKRLFMPYIFFSLIAFLIKGIFSAYTKRPSGLTFHDLLQAFFDPANGPLNEMWFIGTLMWLMAMYPVYKVALKWQWSEILLLGLTLVPFTITTKIEFSGWFHLSGVLKYAFYFVGGALFFKYRLYRWFERKAWIAILLTALFLLENYYITDIPLIKPVTGILMSFAWGISIADMMPGLFGTFRDHSFQIFLLGLFPQMFIELFVWKKFHSEWLQAPYYLLSCISAIVFAVVVSKYAARIKIPWIRWCFGLK